MPQRGELSFVTLLILIGLAVVISTTVALFSFDVFETTKTSTEKLATKTITCFSDVELAIIDACYDTLIRLTIENRQDTEINGNFLLVKVEGSNDVVLQPTPPGINLLPFERKKIAVTYFPEVGEIQKVSLIPRIISDEGPIFCTENIAEVTNIKLC